jgi:O-antigen/teichoic acid export membrane protein
VVDAFPAPLPGENGESGQNAGKDLNCTSAVKPKQTEPGTSSEDEISALRELPIRHSLAYSVAGQLGYVLAQMGVLAALARLRGPEAVGEFGLALALTTPAFMFVNMGGKSSQASDVTRRYSFAEYGGLIVMTAALATAVSIIAGLLFASTRTALMIVVIIAFTKCAESISNLSYGAFQQAGRMDKVGISLVLRGIFTLALFVFLLSVGVATPLAFLAQLLVWSVLAFARDYPLASRMAVGHFVWPSADRKRIIRLAREIGPLGASYLVNSLLVSLPRLFVESSVGLSAVGLLTVVNYFQQAGTLVFNAMSQALVNPFARLRHRNSHDELGRAIRALFAFVSFCCVAGLLLAALLGRWVLVHVFGPQFGSAKNLLLLVAVALCATLYGVLPQSLLHAQRRFTTFLFREIVAVLVCVAFLAVCVPRWGLMGAGYAIVAAAVIRLLVMCFATALWRRPAAPESTSAAGKCGAAL